MRWDDAISEYLCDLQHTGRINSAETVRTYQRMLGLHARDTAHGPIAASREDVKLTLSHWAHPNTRGLAHTVLTSFYDWMLTEGCRLDNPARQVARPRTRKPTTIRLTRREVGAMIAACETQRERWTILLGVCTGARAAELRGFQGRHFARADFVWFSADVAKGKRERWVPVLPELASVVAEIRETVPTDHYVIEAYKCSSRAPLPRTHQVGAASLAAIVRTVAQRAGITARVYPHLLRHAFGDHVAKHAGLRAAQALLGHASVKTTTIYTGCPGLDELAASVCGLRFEETMVERRERFAAQMQTQSAPVTKSHNQTLVMSDRTVIRFDFAR